MCDWQSEEILFIFSLLVKFKGSVYIKLNSAELHSNKTRKILPLKQVSKLIGTLYFQLEVTSMDVKVLFIYLGFDVVFNAVQIIS